jgi:antitoxin component YwqK of YwqJK toxin-antitoxin module
MKYYIKILILILTVSACQKSTKKEVEDFIFLEDSNYMIDSYNGISVFRLGKTKEVMNGYYVVGNDFGKSEEFKVINGILNGPNITYSNDNRIYSKSNYINGRKHGEELIYYPSGKLKKKTKYNKGILVGMQIVYFESGQIRSESKTKNDKVIESTSYDIVGNINSQTFIKDSRTITQQINNGKITYEHIDSNYDNFDAMKFYNDEGELEKFLQMYDNGTDKFIIELDANEKEIQRIDIKNEPKKMFEYQEYFRRLQRE